MATEKHHYIAQEKVREKYLGPANFPKVKSLVKAIQKSSGGWIEATLKKNNTIQFVITGKGCTVEKARESVVYEFEKSAATGVPRVHRAEMVFLKESDHKRLQEEISEDAKNSILLTEGALRKFDILTGASELRQFACGPCRHPWWTYVPRTKPVSSCRICHVRYDALSRSKEFGIGRYICLNCDHTFFARCEATEKHICLHCDKLTGPPYISPRFKPLRHGTRGPPPHRVHKVFNESTVHDSTGSTVATFLTEDLGQDIYVPVASTHFWSRQDYTTRFEDDPETSGPDRPFHIVRAVVSHRPANLGAPVDWGSHPTDTDSESEEVSRKRAQASDSEDSGSDDDHVDKTSVVSSLEGSDPDSGVDTWSKAGSGSSASGATSGSSSAKPSVSSLICDFSNVAEYPGIAFSKQKFAKKMTKKGGIIIGEGAKLSVPPGAISGDEGVTVSLQACVGGPFSLPQDNSDEELVFISPVYLVQPPFAFQENVTLSIHTFVEYDADYDFDDFCFVTSPTQNVLDEKDEPHWVFRKFGSPEFDEETRGSRMRGMICLKHFCFCGLAGILGRKKISYCFYFYKPHLFYTPVTFAIFSVTIHQEVYIENLDRYIKAHIENQKLVPQCRIIKFNGAVSFELPVDTALRQGYSLSSDISPCEIIKEDVDYPLENKRRAVKDITLYPPKIELRIMDKELHTTVPRNLNFQFKVEGFKRNVSLNVSLMHSPSSGADRAISAPTTRAEATSSGESSISGTPRSSIAAGENSDSSTGGISSSTASTPRSTSTATGGGNASSSTKRRSKSSIANAENRVARSGDCSTSADIIRSSSHTSESGLSGIFSSGYVSQDSQEAIGLLNSKPDISKLLNDLVDIAWEWEAIAINLGLEVREIRGIEADITCKREESKLRKVLMKWSEKPLAKPFTWQTIIEVLKEPSLDQHHLADKIAERVSA